MKWKNIFHLWTISLLFYDIITIEYRDQFFIFLKHSFLMYPENLKDTPVILGPTYMRYNLSHTIQFNHLFLSFQIFIIQTIFIL